jgi:hypothetical protein
MTLYVITTWSVTPTATGAVVEAITDLPTNLNLALQTPQPTAEPRYKIRRGVRVECGLLWHWLAPTILPQTEPGATTIHTWSITYPDPTSPPWITPVEGITLTKPNAASIPIQLPGVTMPALPYLSLRSTSIGLVGPNAETPIVYDLLLASGDWPAPLLPASIITLPFAGLVTLTLNPGAGALPNAGYLNFRLQKDSGTSGESRAHLALPGQGAVASGQTLLPSVVLLNHCGAGDEVITVWSHNMAAAALAFPTELQIAYLWLD